MARLVGVDLPREKRLEVALTYIFGMGLTRSQKTLAATGISPDIRVKDLQEADLAKLREYIEANFKIEGDLRREISGDIRRKVEIQSYQGSLGFSCGHYLVTFFLPAIALRGPLRVRAFVCVR